MNLRAATLLGLLVLASATGVVRDARAQEAPTAPQLQNPAALPLRRATFAWDKNLLRAGMSFRDIADHAVTEKLDNGLPNLIVMRAYVFEEGSSDPIGLAARTCSIRYDLWDDVYHVKITDPSGERNAAVINVDGVVRRCAEAQDFPIVDRTLLKKGKAYFLGVIVEVNPISEQMVQQIKQWVSRPTGSTNQLGAGDSLMGSFAVLFVRQIGRSDKTLLFRTQPFVP